MAVPAALDDRLALPLIAAPMTRVSGVELVVAACRSGVIGSLPTHNATEDELPAWLERISDELARARSAGRAPVAPYAANLVVHRTNERRDRDVAQLIEHGTEVVITSVGSPEPVLASLQQAGCVVWADVASMRHVERALALGVDGLVLLSAGAGGQTGWLNPLAFIRAVRERYDGRVVLAGGIADGAALAAAITAGADLAYMGTRFIATDESAAPDDYKSALVEAGPDDIELTSALTGLQANVVASSMPVPDRDVAPGGFQQSTLFSYTDAWSAGHSVCGVREITDVATMVGAIRNEYLAAGGGGWPRREDVARQA